MMMTTQEIYNKVVDHLLTQNAQAKTGNTGRCMYLHPQTGFKCAVGALIAPETYNEKFEGQGISSLYSPESTYVEKDWALLAALDQSGVLSKKEDPKTFNTKLGLLCTLQNVHDGWEPTAWPSRLERVANTFDLSMPEKLKERLGSAHEDE